MITIIDYGMGNLRSVQKAFELFNSKVKVSSSPEDVFASDKVVLPGVGAFNVAMDELIKRDLKDAVIGAVEKSKPFLGICLGLQLLFSESEEGHQTQGLALLRGKVKRFQSLHQLKIPHMGWNKIRLSVIEDHSSVTNHHSPILKGVPDESYMYFVHSYYVEPEDKSIVICETEYGCTFASGIQKDNIFGFQFHPEKSQKLGLKIIENFVGI